jgi:hypothetical protein
MGKKLSEDELLRRACIDAEASQRELLAAWETVSDREGKKFKRELLGFIEQLHAYRMKRWGKTQLEGACDRAIEIPLTQLLDELHSATPTDPSPGE